MNRYDRNLQARYRKERQRNLLARPGEYPFIVVLDHLKPGFNVAKIFRSAQAFGAAAVWLVGIGPFDPAPAKGAFRKVPARFFENFAACHEALVSENYRTFRLDPGARECLTTHPLAGKCAFIFGHEEFGASFAAEAYPEIRNLHIPQVGPVQSLNVSIAASICMYEYVRQVSAAIRD